MIAAPFFVFILGTIVGSFVNVLALRYNTGLSFFSGRSKCFSCGKTLQAHELVPVLSFLFLGGKCSSCKSRISWQYPLVELVTGFLFLLAYLTIGAVPALLLSVIMIVLLLAIGLYDLKHMIIPDGLVFLFDAIALVSFFLSNTWHPFWQSLDFWAGPILFAFLAFFWLVSGGRWMGFGDAKLVIGTGWMLGFSGGIFALMLAFWLGALWGILVMVLGRIGLTKTKLKGSSEVPFAPFIISAALLQLFGNFAIAHVLFPY